MPNREQYETIDGGEASGRRPSVPRDARIVLATVLVFALVVVVAGTTATGWLMGSGLRGGDSISASMLESEGAESTTTTTKKARACALKECFGTSCDHDVAPFVCLFHNGGPHGGWYVTAHNQRLLG
jgi:hypothetical protein